MTQNGVVTKILDHQMAEVTVLRGTACGGNCGGNCSSCEACAYESRLTVKALNRIYAGVGERVLITGKTSQILGTTLLIYMLPLAIFFVAYAIAYSFGLGQGMCILISFLGLAIGAAAVVILGRRKKEMEYEITSYLS